MSSQTLHWHGYFISNGFCYCVTAIPWAWFSTVMKLALIASPVAALYSPTVLAFNVLPLFNTKRMPSDNASAMGALSPVMNFLLNGVPVLALYSLTTPVGTPTVAAWVIYRFARALLGMAQRP